MHRQATKATRLEALARIVPVPAFVYVRCGAAVPQGWCRADASYMVRGVSAVEDGVTSSHAGQFVTHGPLAADAVADAVADICARPTALGAIVQTFVPGESGVAFCLTPERYYVEYANVREGVTAGRVQPSVALLPGGPARYDALTQHLRTIVRTFGVCEVEFVGVRAPQFVQVRPITRTFTIDAPLLRTQMALQEHGSLDLVENDVAQTIGEYAAAGGTFAHYYARAVTRVRRRVLQADTPPLGAMRIGRQVFVAAAFVRATRLTLRQAMRVLWAFVRERATLERVERTASVTTLVERSYIVAIVYALTRSRRLFRVREAYRAVLERRMAQRPARDMPQVASSVALASPLTYDAQRMVWRAFARKDSAGVVVVPGDFTQGPFFRYRPGATVPAGVIVLTDYLYAQLGPSLPTLRGVICANGSLNAHLAILAREHNTPMLIQVGAHLADYAAEA